jgi:tetratricopeptide (TPR) repeat protein
MRADRPLLALTLLALAGCASGPLPGDDQPTLAALARRPLPTIERGRLASDEARALRAWQAVLQAEPDPRQRAQALRRLGDLSLDLTEARLAGDPAAPTDTAEAIAHYQRRLQDYPQASDTDRVLYQLARAQDLGAQPAAALATLDRLVRQHPDTALRDEAQFRRGELLFSARRWADAELAFTAVVDSPRPQPFTERARYMQGWSRFKQARLEPALDSFMAVLDPHLGGRDPALPLEQLPGLSRADRELVDDVLRVLGLTLENLQGAASIPPLIDRPQRAGYELRLYQRLSAMYLQQDRPKDAADALAAYLARHPLDAQAPWLQARIAAIHADAGFAQPAQAAREALADRYAIDPAFRLAQPEAFERARPLLREQLAGLAQRQHARAQRERRPEDVAAAVRWYRALLALAPDDADAPTQRFLLAELLFEDRQWAAAGTEYEASAYQDPPHPRQAEAGYGALLALDQRLAAAPQDPALAAERLASAQRFAQRHAADPRAPVVLADVAERLMRAEQPEAAAQAARRVLAWQPQAAAAPRRSALGVLAQTAFEAGRYDEAEAHTRAVLALAPPERTAALRERLATAVYRQAEAARDRGDRAAAAAQFARVAEAAPDAPIRAHADFDAAAQWIALQDWPRAATALEAFRRQHPQHPLQAQVPARLALAYDELQRPGAAAAEYERVAAAAQANPDTRRTALWLAAQRRDSARDGAAAAWERYLQAFAQPLPEATEARARLAALARERGDPRAALAWQRELLAAERAGGEARSPRTRALAAEAALALAAPEAEAFRAVALAEPLAKSLALKKQRLDTALQAYARAAEDAPPAVVSAAAFARGALYQDFGRALLQSQRPKKLSALEREQYDVLLEEQAFPFEEKAIEWHEGNVARARRVGLDEGIRQSLDALRGLRPARWAKAEREDASDSPAAPRLREALSQRQRGDFAGARATLERLLAEQPDHPVANLNLGVLLDLYLDEPQAALARFQAALDASPAGDAPLAKWVAELKPRAARAAKAAAASPAKEPVKEPS